MNLEGDIHSGQTVLVAFKPNGRPCTYRAARIEKVQKLHVVLDDGTKWSRKGNHPANNPYAGGKLLDPANLEVQMQRALDDAEHEQVVARVDASRLFDGLMRKGHKAADWKAILAFLEQQGTPTA